MCFSQLYVDMYMWCILLSSAIHSIAWLQCCSYFAEHYTQLVGYYLGAEN